MKRMTTGVAILVLVLGALVAPPASAGTRERIAKVRRLYADLVGTGPTDVLAGRLSVEKIFDPAVKGRVTPLGQYGDFEAAREYFFGLLLAPTVSALRVDFRSLAASGHLVAIEMDIAIDLSHTPVGRVVALRETGFFRFGAHDRITSFDLTILNIGAALDPRSDDERQRRIQGVCALAAANCPNEFVGDTTAVKAADCEAFVATKPYGSWNRGNSDTFSCRELHVILTALRPEIHCPHVGKTGGNACVDVSYESFFDQEF